MKRVYSKEEQNKSDSAVDLGLTPEGQSSQGTQPRKQPRKQPGFAGTIFVATTIAVLMTTAGLSIANHEPRSQGAAIAGDSVTLGEPDTLRTPYAPRKTVVQSEPVTISEPEAQSKPVATVVPLLDEEESNWEIYPVYSYDEIFQAIQPLGKPVYIVICPSVASSQHDDTLASPATEEGATSTGNAGSSGAVTYDTAQNSGTVEGDLPQADAQVADLESASIIKTNGEYLYYLYNNAIIICVADGKYTRQIARISVGIGTLQDFYLSDDRLVVMLHKDGNKSELYDRNDHHLSGYRDTYHDRGLYDWVSFAAVYDISDPKMPRLINMFGQDGKLESSRMVDGILYVVSLHTVNTSLARSDAPQTFVPNCYDGIIRNAEKLDSMARPLAAEEISLSSVCTSPQYTVVTSIDINLSERKSEISLLSSLTSVSMNQDHLLLLDQRSRTNRFLQNYLALEEGELYEVATSSRKTRIVRLDYNNGCMNWGNKVVVEGWLANQFHLDEYAGYLRIATTQIESFATLNGKRIDSSNPPSVYTHSVFIFDSNMELVGSVEDIGSGYRIYAARFIGDVGYIHTWGNPIPIFSLDLSDPMNPCISGVTDIPAESEYLLPYSEGRLLSLKLAMPYSGKIRIAMLDRIDSSALEEAHDVLLKTTTAEALTDYQALFINAENNLIGFTVNTSAVSSPLGNQTETPITFMIYDYSDDAGFTTRAKIPLSKDGASTRALCIDDYLYVFHGSSIGVYDLETFSEATQLRA
ncbi:MAG: beta-propeller domain-containing protein [Coriobacteriia bacterium]|nr:beta-propeller domain-containing protein [Coriobacteriia bacterium]